MVAPDSSSDSTSPPLLLAYAPPISGSLRRYLVIPFGLLSTALVLFGVYLFRRWEDTDVLALHWFYLIPVGAMIAGGMAGIGYWIAGHLAGWRVNRLVLLMIVLIQIIAYFAAQYIEFRSKGTVIEIATGRPIGFLRYFHLMTISMRWVSHGTATELGLGGYLVRGLELFGFVGCSILLLATLSGGNYCDLCSRYRESKLLTLIPASAPYPTELNDQTRADFEDRSTAFMESAEKRLERLDRFAADGDVTSFLAELDQGRLESEGAGKLPTRIRLELSYCPNCHDGTLVQSVKMGQEVSLTTTMLPSINLTRDFVAAIVKRKKNR
jgi:hypothetical protein